MDKTQTRCGWVKLKNPTYVQYHDTEWGVPVYEDSKLFEFLVLESAQAGMSWEIILNKREGYRKAFAGFDAESVAVFDANEVDLLLQNPAIIRNRLKIEAAITNAKQFLRIAKQYGSFANFIWGFTDGKRIINHFKELHEIPTQTELSDKIAKELKKEGFKFLGSKTVYAHLQATGIVNDHLVGCFRHSQV
jgi:DNA-3-methyladenine glycosylase I